MIPLIFDVFCLLQCLFLALWVLALFFFLSPFLFVFNLTCSSETAAHLQCG